MEKNTGEIIRVAVVGPESTGKTTLAAELAAHFGTLWVPEFARAYIENLGRHYTLEDLLYIAQRQLESENRKMEEATDLLFSDTEMIINKVWAEDVFKKVPGWITENLEKTKHDLYLLTWPDIEWVKDQVRENPHRREFLFDWYKREIENLNGEYSIIKGNGPDRLKNAIDAVKDFLERKKKSAL